jgi:hypothetical protein
MNDLDLRAALHRDADLVGEPAPDLLDQLSRRRQHQQRQRAGFLAVGLAVVVIGAGIPVASSFMTQSDAGPATDPTPSISTEGPPTTAAPTTTPTVVVPPPVETPVPEVPVDEPPTCPDRTVLEATLPPDTAAVTYSMHHTETAVCSGIWAATGYTVTRVYGAGEPYSYIDDQGVLVEGITESEYGNGEAGLFRYVDGSWTFHFRDDYCDKITLPDVIWERACTVD